jgi:ferredoxin
MRLSEYDQFADGLIDVFLSVKPVLNIMDAVLSMEGYGPTAGNPRQTGLILASEDAFALDSAAVAIVGINPADVPVLKQGRERSLAPADLSSIEFSDEKPEAVKVPDFKIPQLDKLLTIQFVRAYPFLQFLMESFRPRPVFTNRCVKCGECAELCPAKVLTMGKNGPSVNLKKCIRCFCCQELCRVKAVEIKRRFLARAALAAMQGVMLAVKPFLRRLKY